MKITALRLHNVKRFAGRGVAIEGIGEGVNVLCAANEFGKSTSFEALHALFFLPHSSQSNDVKALRPYAGGSPLVEADIATEKGRFRISKQFHGGRAARVSDLSTGRLLAQADEAENFIAALVRGGTTGPAGLLWVRQGVTGIEQRSRSEEDREKQIRAGLLESVQGEVEAVTGGRRMATIIARVQTTLGELVTATGRPKTGGRYEGAIRERDALQERETKLETDVEALRAFLDQRETAARKLAELDREEDRAERRASIQRAQAEFDAAKAQSERLRAAQAELRLARERRDGAERELTGFRAALAASVRLAADLEAAERAGHEAVERRAQATAAAEAARLAGEAAEREETQARVLLARRQAALRAREAAERLSERSERLEKATSAQRLIEERTARLAHLKIPAKAVDELQALEIEIVRLRAAAEAAQPSVAIAYEPGAGSRVVMDGATLEETAPRGYEAKAELIVPGVGTLTLRSNRVEGGRAAIGQAEGRRRASLETLGVASLAQARERQSAAERAEGEIRQAQAELKLLAPEGLAELRETIAAHRPMDGNDLELQGDPDAAALALEAAETRRREAHEAGRAAVPLQRRADDAFVEARAHLARIEAEMAQVAATLGPAADRGSREDALAQGLREAEARFADAGRDAERLREAGTDLAAREATLKRLVSVAEAAAKETQTLRDTLVGLNAQIEARAEEAVEENWRECGEALGAAEARVAAFEREVAVLQRLSTTLAEARSQARELYLRPVMAELKPLLGLLFADASIVFDETTLLPHRIERGGVHEEVDRLSGGMREQLSVLTRLAFARLLAKDGRPAPVILDDALVYSDDDRIEKMFDALHRQSSDQQIIVFSCRQRAFQRLGGNVLQMVEWVPSQS